MKFDKFVEWAFYGIIGTAAILGVEILSDLNKSVNQLNIQMATVIEKNNWVMRTLESQDARIQALERKN